MDRDVAQNSLMHVVYTASVSKLLLLFKLCLIIRLTHAAVRHHVEDSHEQEAHRRSSPPLMLLATKHAGHSSSHANRVGAIDRCRAGVAPPP
jgi:hypothetical protein